MFIKFGTITSAVMLILILALSYNAFADQLCDFDFLDNFKSSGKYELPIFSSEISEHDCDTRALAECKNIYGLNNCEITTRNTNRDGKTGPIWNCIAKGERPKDLGRFDLWTLICNKIDRCIHDTVNDSTKTEEDLKKLQLLSELKKCNDAKHGSELRELDSPSIRKEEPKYDYERNHEKQETRTRSRTFTATKSITWGYSCDDFSQTADGLRASAIAAAEEKCSEKCDHCSPGTATSLYETARYPSSRGGYGRWTCETVGTARGRLCE